MYDVTKISYTPGDILIFAVDMDMYDCEECNAIYDAIHKEAPDVKVVFVPDDLVEEIIHIKKDSPLYVGGLTTTTTNVYDHNYPQPYLTNISSDSTLGVVDRASMEDTQW